MNQIPVIGIQLSREFVVSWANSGELKKMQEKKMISQEMEKALNIQINKEMYSVMRGEDILEPGQYVLINVK